MFFRQCQQNIGIDPVIAEKDFWVCWLLGRLFAEPKLGNDCVFKGGTSLSKVFGVIERFSEDIDLAIMPASLGWQEADLDQAPSRTKREKLMHELEEVCAEAARSVWLPRLEAAVQAVLGSPKDRSQWLVYQFDAVARSPVLYFAYPGALPRGVAYIPREVKIEFGSLTDQRPTGRHTIRAFIDDLAPGVFADARTAVVALDLERTFWEKATILHAEFFRPPDQQIKMRNARHYADFAALWRHRAAYAARTRLDLLERVRLHKSRFFAVSWANYATAVPGSFRLVPPAARVDALRADYEAMRQMFLNEPLPFDELLSVLREAETALNGG